MTDPQLELPAAAEVAGLRLVATDMDGTLLDGDHRIDPSFWDVADELAVRGVELCVASGRQLGALELVLGERFEALTVIADNGAVVLRHGEQLHISPVDHALVVEFADRIRRLASRGHQVAATISGRHGAYIEGRDPIALDEARRYYPHAVEVEDLAGVEAAALKVSAYDVAPIGEAVLPAIADLAAGYAILQGHDHWVDINAAGTNKGAALRMIQAAVGADREHTAAFGDQPNDLELLRAAGMSWAMANAHQDVLATGRFRAPANTEGGVIRTLAALLDLLG
ncbi:Cof-type HAD-IIB family hydrolase [Actinotalea sp. M2MS4P-6]|uniref:HAD-IIB family hydrolase n=1 Tax=Actinotalea sp. M2MS4P-6 TaxID=2983762 RepID=UPI0021E4573B|nr:HAD family hydrolase [Actinotalea sp. M2MS4P-6]MCV2393199.1 Cof-type HAD-IIB family hydrolase [Actinotalea sp. M2MS4P-6]